MNQTQIDRLHDLLAILEGNRDERAREWTSAERDQFLDLAYDRIEQLEAGPENRTDAENDEYNTLVALT